MRREPIWVLGLPGIGVARVAALLASHPDLRLLPELNLLLGDTVGTLTLTFERSQDRLGDGLLRAVARVLLQADDSDGIEAARDWLWRRAQWPIAALYATLQQACRPAVAVIPDVQAGWRADCLTRLDALPACRIVHLLQHPATYCREYTVKLQEQRFVPPEFRDFCNDPVGVIDPQIAWYRYNQNLHQAFAQHPRHQYLSLALEDLQATPGPSLDRLQQQLGLSRVSSDALLTSPVDPFLCPGPPTAPGGVEFECRAEPRLTLDLRPTPTWPKRADWRPDAPLSSHEVGALAAELGYCG